MVGRRRVLTGLGASALTLLLSRKASAAPFGTFARSAAPAAPEHSLVKNVLEIYLYGGLSPWESFYFVPDRGKRQKTFYYAYEGTENQAALQACGEQDARSLPFARDGRGVDVHLGPFARALFEREDLLGRMRVVVQRHSLLPHEAAVPYGIAGKFVGTPSLACLGAHVQRAALDRAAREVPYSFVLMNSLAVPSDNTDSFVATGLHPGSARPLRLNIDDAARLRTLLSRPSVELEHRAAYDAYLRARVERYRARLRHGEKGEPLRSKADRELAASINAVAHSDGISRVLPERLLGSLPESELCGQRGPNTSRAGLALATHLLNHPKTPARYVCLLDTGLVPASGGGGYDTHAQDEQIVQFTNLENLLTSLAAVINRPGEHAPDKLDLDSTLIILNTEFGRTPDKQEGSGGRNHHAGGYVTVFMGGPVEGRSLYGAIDERGEASEFVTPAENRIATLVALGISPFAAEAFSLSEVPAARSEAEAIRLVRERVFGRT